MKVLLYSPAFHPSLGGLEEVVALLGEELHRAGHEVTVVCRTAGEGAEPFPFPVVRHPGRRELLRLARWCDVYFQANVSLRGLWPLALVRRPWVVAHHSWYRQADGRIAWQDRLKRSLLRFAAASVAVSRAMAQDLATPSTVIHNPYRDDLFRPLPGIERTRDLVFVGRLVSDKGVDVLLEGLGLLAREGRRPELTVVGDGPERRPLERQAEALGLGGQVRFLGSRRGDELVRILHRHRILVAPSRYREPFGIVALEGIACGCAVVGSRDGGLVEAMGPCGRSFPNGDAGALARVLDTLLGDPEALAALTRQREAHLADHKRRPVAGRYIEVLEAAAGRRRDAPAGNATPRPTTR